MKTYLPVGEVGQKVNLADDKFTQGLLHSGIIAELKVVEPTETKKRKPRSKKAD